MKRVISLGLTALMLLTFCLTGIPALAEEAADDAIVIRLPEALYTNMSEADIRARMEDEGYTDISFGGDGTVTGKLTSDKQQALVDEYRQALENNIEGLKDMGPGNLTPVEDSQWNDDLSRIDIMLAGGAAPNMFDKVIANMFVRFAGQHQLLLGVDYDEADAVIEYVDGSGNVLWSSSYRQWLASTAGDAGAAPAAPEATPAPTMLADGDTVTVEDVCEFTMNGWKTGEELSETDGMMKRFVGTGKGEGTVVVWLVVPYKNLRTEEVSSARVLEQSTLLYDGKYEYEGGSGAYSGDIVPLATQDVFFYYRVPAEVMESDASLVATFQVKGDDTVYSYTIR